MKSLNADALIDAGRGLTTPFDVSVRVGDDDITLTFIRILRLLPSKRIVAVARHGDDEILVKAYLGRSARRYAHREYRGVKLIVDAGVRTPELKWRGKFLDGGGEVLAFRYLADAVSLHDRWRAAEQEEEKVDVLTRAMVIMGKLHNQGVVQNDIHLANFLLSEGKLYTIDGGDINKKSEPPLPEGPSLKNLGLFFAQFFPKYDDFVQIALPAYEAVRGWEFSETRFQKLEEEIGANRERRKKVYISKAFRECTRFICSSDFSRFQVCERASWNNEMAEVMRDPDAAIENATLLKDGNTSTVALVTLSDRMLVIKRYNLKNTWHRVRRAVRPSRAWTSWANACRMEFLGIPSVKPIAMIENRFGPLRGTAYFITDYVKGEDALHCIRSMKKPNGELEALTEILHHLSKSRISHGDLKATNFVMSDHGPIILDLDAMKEHRTRQGFRRAFRRDLDRFMQNWQDRPELANRFAGLIGNLSY